MNNKLEFYGENPFLILFITPIALFVLIISGVAIFLEYNFLIKLLCVFMFFILTRFIVKNTIYKVILTDENITVKYLFLRDVVLNYSQITSVSNHQEGFIPISVILMKVKASSSKKIHFHCPKSFREKLSVFLISKELKIIG